MDDLQIKETICKHCGEVFPSKGRYQAHYRRVHQNEIRIRHSEQGQIFIHRSDNQKFDCICGKSYYIRQSLYRHQKSCQQWNDYQANYEDDSNSEISIQGNFILNIYSNS